MDLKKLIKDYMEQQQAMQIATTKNGQPRLCTVHYAFDDLENIYWVSSRNSHHSQDIRENKNTAVAILINADKRQCIHFEGEAFELQGEQTRKADEVYGKRFGISKERLESALALNKNNPAYYVFRPKHGTLIDAELFPSSPKQELEI